jgi:CoA:oxalate CoA-transferase
MGHVDAVVIELPRQDDLTSSIVLDKLADAGAAPLVVECSFTGRSDNDQPPLDEFLLQAASGILAHTGDPERGACRLGGQFARTLVSVEAAAAIVTGLYARRDAAPVGVLRLNAIAALAFCCFHRRLMAETGHENPGFVGSGISRNNRRLRLIYATQDGRIVVPYHLRNMLPRARAWMADMNANSASLDAMDSILTASVFGSSQEEIEVMETGLDDVFAQLPTDAAVVEAQKRGLPAEGIKTLSQVGRDPHLDDQGVLRVSDSGELLVGSPYVLTENKSRKSPARVARTSGPGEDQTASENEQGLRRRLPLRGLRVVTFTTMLAGPILGKRFCDLGAEVWRIESSVAEDFTRSSPPFVELSSGDRISGIFAGANTGVKSVQLDMGIGSDARIAEELIAKADVLVENMRPGLLGKWGLETERLWELNERLVIVRLSGMGQTGPYAGHRIVGQSMAAVSGELDMTGWPDRAPVLSDVPAGDFLAPAFGLLTALSALRARETTNSGYQIDYSEFAGLVYSVLDEVSSVVQDGRCLSRMGLRDPLSPSQGCGLLTCSDGRQVAVLGPDAAGPGSDQSPRELADAVEDWLRGLQGEVGHLGWRDAIAFLGGKSIEAVPYVEPGDLPNQEGLVEMGYYGRLKNSIGSNVLIDGPPIAEYGPYPREYDASSLGADTEAVLKDLASEDAGSADFETGEDQPMI